MTTSTTITGYAAELRQGDILLTAGGKGLVRSYKRYRFGQSGAPVLEAFRTPRARTRMHLRLEGFPEYVLAGDYPVEYVRPTTSERQAAAVAAAAQQATDLATLAAGMAAGAAKRAERLANR